MGKILSVRSGREKGREMGELTMWAGSWRCTKGRHPRYNLGLRPTNNFSSEKYLIPAIV